MQAWGLTEPGMVRNQNQDYYLIQKLSRDQLLVIVCDGMGGARSGNIASKMAVEVFSDEVRRTVRSNMKPERIDGMLSTALELANKAVYEQSQLSEEYKGMGTTLVAVVSQTTDGMSWDLGPVHIENEGIAVGTLVVLFALGYIFFCKADKLTKEMQT